MQVFTITFTVPRVNTPDDKLIEEQMKKLIEQNKMLMDQCDTLRKERAANAEWKTNEELMVRNLRQEYGAARNIITDKEAEIKQLKKHVETLKSSCWTIREAQELQELKSWKTLHEAEMEDLKRLLLARGADVVLLERKKKELETRVEAAKLMAAAVAEMQEETKKVLEKYDSLKFDADKMVMKHDEQMRDLKRQLTEAQMNSGREAELKNINEALRTTNNLLADHQNKQCDVLKENEKKISELKKRVDELTEGCRRVEKQRDDAESKCNKAYMKLEGYERKAYEPQWQDEGTRKTREALNEALIKIATLESASVVMTQQLDDLAQKYKNKKYGLIQEKNRLRIELNERNARVAELEVLKNVMQFHEREEIVRICGKAFGSLTEVANPYYKKTMPVGDVGSSLKVGEINPYFKEQTKQ